jgi:haloacetate dehalogenase
MRFGLNYWHWFFLAQPFDTPERIIGADPRGYFTRQWPRDAGGTPVPPAYFAPEAVDDYLRCYLNPDTVHATCEDYRAGASFDFELDELDRTSGRRINCPVLALWAARGPLPKLYDVLGIWRDWATDVHGQGIDSGHYLAEEAPDATHLALRSFLQL